MKYNKQLILSIILFHFAAITCIAYTAYCSSPQFSIEVDIMGGGGGRSSSTNYNFSSSIGEPLSTERLLSSNFINYAGYSYALNKISTTTACYSISGAGYNLPEQPFRASLAMYIDGTDLTDSWLRYRYSRNRLSFMSTSIVSVNVSDNIATINGTGEVNRIPHYTFTAIISKSNPDQIGIEIFKPESIGGSLYYRATPLALTEGNFIIETE